MPSEAGRNHDAIVRRHGPRLLATARRLLRSEKDARDAVQEVLVRALDEVPGLDHPRQKLEAWLQSDLVAVCLAKLRDAVAAPAPSIDHLLPRYDETGHRSGPPPKPGSCPEAATSSALVRTSIAKLPEIYRIVLLLRDVEGLSTAQTARALGLEEDAVKIRLHRARQALLTLLRSGISAGAAGRSPPAD